MSMYLKENNINFINLPFIVVSSKTIQRIKTPTKATCSSKRSNQKAKVPSQKNGSPSSNFPPKGFTYRTELCKNYEMTGTCKYGNKCDYAHGLHDLRQKDQVNHYFRLKNCKSFFANGYCPYGVRCQFSHSIYNKMDMNTFVFIFSLFGACKNRLSVFKEFCC